MKRFAILSILIGAIALTVGVGYNSHETEKHPTYQASVIQDEILADFHSTAFAVKEVESVPTFNLVVPEQLVPKPFTFYVEISRVNFNRPNERPPNFG